MKIAGLVFGAMPDVVLLHFLKCRENLDCIIRDDIMTLKVMILE